MTSIQYPDGRPRTNDIDFVSFKNDFIELGECKQFVAGKSEMWLDSTKIAMLKLFGKIIGKFNRKIFLTGTDSYSLTRPTDFMYFTTLDSVLSGETPSKTCSGNIIIEKDNMIKSTREGFSELCNGLLDHFGRDIGSLTFKHLR
ncbi:hypothetical protein HX833_06425 [Marine Group I thaumarchaeote]|uniref:Uncharacterized protein n=1 Tax=Marine Group I thaumarchaeote TaxID=2511932 RepID=A0A7K4NTH8_9ARCH|nr:hypothetical protein [Marine Group I thaumarchaeote]